MEFFLISAPGLAPLVGDEARAAGFKVTAIDAAGVSVDGDWPDIWRANLELRGPTRILVRMASFRAMHLAQLDKRSRKLPWADWLTPDVPVTVEATCRKSRIYHAGAAAERVSTALSEATGAPVSAKGGLAVKVRIEDDLCTISVDTSGAALHKRGLKPRVNKAPMRETLAALFLRAAGFDGTGPVVDPMCGSGTFLLEAADIASGLQAGRNRRFAFQDLATFDAGLFADLCRDMPKPTGPARFFGSDRDAGAIAISTANADHAGLSSLTNFTHQPISDLTPPDGPPGLVICNPPYGGRIGQTGALTALYRSFGDVMSDRFVGWKVALITSDGGLARATGLPFAAPGPIVDHGGIKIRLWQAAL